jgi:hypothetical protein
VTTLATGVAALRCGVGGRCLARGALELRCFCNAREGESTLSEKNTPVKVFFFRNDFGMLRNGFYLTDFGVLGGIGVVY